MQHIIKKSQEYSYPAKVALVVSDEPNAPGIKIAKDWNIPIIIFNKEILNNLEYYKIDFCILAGYMSILKEDIINRYKNRILNIHPSLLPLHKGKDAQEKALKSNALISGCTVHIVEKKVDSGKILARVAIPILANDTKESLKNKILHLEHLLYPEVISNYIKTYEN